MASDEESVDPFADLPGDVGDNRKKFVRVTFANGDQVEHGDIYLRYTDQEFILADSMDFADDETTRYRKGEVVHVEVQQHHPKCFITTAVADAATLNTLRGFRNDVMATSTIGQPLLRIYDLLSPRIAQKLARNPNSRTARAVRWFVNLSAAVEQERHRRPYLSRALKVAITVLYLVGLIVAISGSLAITIRNILTD